MIPNQLHIESLQGHPVADYRIHHGHIEVRVIEGGEWRRLSAREFSAHLAQNPALAEWLRARAQQRIGPPQDEATAA
ncbi:MAG TPA: hypothetical protein VLT85_02130 [Terriglobales bacterium]|nr:hypothetical protein [Terriglobales bacterium]